MNEIVLFTVSALPVFLIGLFIYKKDKDKEPTKLLTKLFLGGILSCFLVIAITAIMTIFFPIMSKDISTLNLIELLFMAFIGVALVEESSKWIFVYKFSYHDKDFSRLYDMIVYSVFVALGFAFFENLLYVYQNGVGVGVVRALLAVPGHACDGIFMGYFLGLAKLSSINNRDDLRKKYVLFSLLVPILLHGIYDYCLFTGNIIFIVLFFIFVILMYIFAIKRVKKISAIDRKFKYIDNFCPICGREVNSEYCPICGRKNE